MHDFQHFFELACERFPDSNFDKIIHLGWNKVDIVKKVAEQLFIAGDVNSELANITRDNLVSLASEGVHCFAA